MMDLLNNKEGEALILDGSEETFMDDVVEESKNQPVIVDFWAPWCGPCKTLGPALEAEVKAYAGAVKMVKIDVDRNQAIAQQMRIQSIPAVFAFVDGQPVDGFQGAKTPAEIKEFLKKVSSLNPNKQQDNGLEAALEMAEKMLSEEKAVEALEIFSAIVSEDPKNIKGCSGIIRAHLNMGNLNEAQNLIASLPDDIKENSQLDPLKTKVELAIEAESFGSIEELKKTVSSQPDNYRAALELGIALNAKGNYEEAIEMILGILRHDLEWSDGEAKNQLLKIFSSMNPDDPVALKGRRKLSSIIFA